MLDIKSLRQRPEAAADALERRGFVFDLRAFQVLEQERKRLQSETETLQSERNKVSKTIGNAKEEGEDI